MFAAHHCQHEPHTTITSLTHIIAQLVTEFQLLPTQCVGYLQRGEVTTHIYTFSFPPSLPPSSYELTSSTYMTIDKAMHHPYPLWTLTNTRHQGSIAPHPSLHTLEYISGTIPRHQGTISPLLLVYGWAHPHTQFRCLKVH